MNQRASCARYVMVVDDDADIREVIVEVLADGAYRALASENGKEALLALRSRTERPCVILLDIMMPVMDGWQFRSAQRADPEIGAIPVVVLSAHADVQQAAAVMGAAGFLRKPVDLDALLAAVERFCA